MKQHQKGFSLIEVAVVLFVLVLLLGSLLVPLTTQVEQRQISETEKTLESIRDALLGFAIANGHLPCPDTDNNGLEDINTVNDRCSVISTSISAGNLPWQTLGLGNSDVWGNRFRYVVREEYARRPPLSTTFTLSTTANVRVCTVAACSPASNVLTSTAVAAVISHGKNGLGAINSLSGVSNPSPTSLDELQNTNNDRDIVSRTISAASANTIEFDDIVVWLPQYILFNRMVTAGRLP
ncbi:MAG: prepilin-type N-terminal cleavage/methylation domain-containing protein [Burkholderiales bacterium]|nr:prepilin-type N-terminal cleavage/methylation domain-containing protein [Burkholderiales bacterium]